MAQNQNIVTKSPRGAYGNSAKSLTPSPAQQNLDAELAALETEAPAAANIPAQAVGSNLDAELAALEGNVAPSATPVTPQEQPIQMEAEPSFAQANLTRQGIANQAIDAFQRFKYAFTTSDKEAVKTLKDSGAYQDVRKNSEGDILIQRKGAKKYEKFDKSTFELVGDLLDQSRVAVEGAAELGGRVAGAVGGAITGAATGLGVGAVPGAAIGQAVGGGVAATAAQNATDLFAQYALGIERDGDRSRLAESATTFGLSTLFTGLGAKIAAKAASSTAKKEAFAVTKDFVQTKIDEAAEAIQEIKTAGIMKQGDEFFLDPAQTAGQIVPEFARGAKDLASDRSFQAFRLKQGKVLQDAYDTVAQSIGNSVGRPGRSQNFSLDVNDLKKFEGETIGKFREAALASSKGSPQVLPKFQEALSKASGSLGVPPGSSLGDYVKAAQASLPELPPSQAAAYAKTLHSFDSLVARNKGALPLGTIDKEYQNLTGQINRLMKSQNGRDLGGLFIDLKNGLRDDWTTAIGNNTSGATKSAYQEALGTYSATMTNIKDLGSLIKQDNVSLDALSQAIFKPGMKADQVKAVKTLAQSSDPQMWRDITGEYMNSLKAKHSSGDSIDWTKVQKSLGSLSSDVQKEILEGSGYTMKTFDALSKVDLAFKAGGGTNFDVQPSPKQKHLLVRAISAMMSPGSLLSEEQATSAINSLGTNRNLGTWLKEGGAKELLKQLPEGRQQTLFNKFISNYDPNAKSTISNVVKKGTKAADVAVRRGVVNSELFRNEGEGQ
jgi:hypothetical protein